VITGVGVDIADIDRFRRITFERGDRFIQRVFTEREVDYCWRCAHPEERFAARFAAKEAVFKALRIGWQEGLTFRDVEVVNGPLGEPRIVLWRGAARIAGEKGITHFHVSLSHTDAYAVAQVVAERLEGASEDWSE
jgi:holo-[acyl-carrier protein] synthase